jgi:hypothetical protein
MMSLLIFLSLKRQINYEKNIILFFILTINLTLNKYYKIV